MMEILVSWAGAHPIWTGLIAVLIIVLFLTVQDIIQNKHAIRRAFPFVGRFRYLFEKVGPELRQYFVAHDKEELPFNRDERRWVYATSKAQNSNFGFGTNEELYSVGYPIIKHAAFPVSQDKIVHIGQDKTAVPCLKVMGQVHDRARPYRPNSIINISAMSYGSLGKNAISALNLGAAQADCFHNTGEGSVSPYHLLGADLMWQLGTGYFGARASDGGFDMAQLVKRCEAHESIRSIEIKLSQGAKPGKGGILPGSKVTEEIAKARGVEAGKAVLSPNGHSAFHDVDSMIDFIEIIARETGLPVGIKSAIGEIEFWQELAEKMKSRGEGPDFITIDGGEGGTGAAPLTYADHVALPFKVGFKRVYMTFMAAGIHEDIVWIGSGKLGFPDRAVIALAMGCDLISVAREAMLALGCIQSLKCHRGNCPTGIATHNPWLERSLNVDLKAERFSRYVQGFRKELLQLAHSSGYHHPAEFRGKDIEFSVGVNAFADLNAVLGYTRKPSSFTTLSDYQ
jgi:glutamate synthase domain-containing protein 2